MIIMINDRFYNEQEIRQLIQSQAEQITKLKQLLLQACSDFGERMNLTIIKDNISSIPAADVQLVKRGKWLIKENHFHSCGIMLYAECSCCGHTCSTPESEHNNYCPNCGADMRGDENGKEI